MRTLLGILLIVLGPLLYGQDHSSTLRYHAKFDGVLGNNPDSAFELASELIEEAELEKDEFSLAVGYHDLANVLWIRGEYSEALQFYYKALSIFEELQDPWGQIITYNDASLIFTEEKGYDRALRSLNQAEKINRNYKDTTLDIVLKINTADNYIYLNQLDSALIHLEEALKLVPNSRNQNYIYGIYHNLGRVYDKTGKDSLGAEYLDKAAFLAKKNDDLRYLSEILIHKCEYFIERQMRDSALLTAHLAMDIARDLESEKRQLDAVRLLQRIYESSDLIDSAFKYSKLRLNLNTVIAGVEEIRRLENLVYMEKLRQKERLKELREREEAQEHMLQYLFITSIIFVLFVTVFLHRLNKIQFRYIDTILFVGLLFVFEFIALLVHTVAGKFTHHSPLFTFLILVGVALIMIPLHRRLEIYSEELILRKNKKPTNR